MKKIISIHLANRMFQIEEDAYSYMNNALRGQWKKEELEKQIADQLEKKLTNSKTVITYPDVVDALYQLGFSASEYKEATSANEKRIYRSMKEKMIGGVCGGLAEYFEIDPVILRVLFVIALFFGTMGFWLYILLWIVIPKKK
jgi:Putative stress-responsive transcriptional regulator